MHHARNYSKVKAIAQQVSQCDVFNQFYLQPLAQNKKVIYNPSAALEARTSCRYICPFGGLLLIDFCASSHICWSVAVFLYVGYPAC
jgi:hypothetical protein